MQGHDLAPAMPPKGNFAEALRAARIHAGLTQEDFGVVSSRTYVSTLERGQNSPTLEKIEHLAGALQVHPLTLVALAYQIGMPRRAQHALWAQVEGELQALNERTTRRRIRRAKPD